MPTEVREAAAVNLKTLFWTRITALIVIFWTVLIFLGVGALGVLAVQHRDNGSCATMERAGRGALADCH